ncbi:hypothetical protein JJJ17_07850 [Paracoccus caeni]|uniref:Uncharacterized protein n=1 Tax=Paracoccus caeni TaxID=657651 RepID=A0A934W0I9_9RHOB|nr:hypothetical protein [Paracoccus caeni]MBK4215834.1 hypothetical protein [Paracoccus caeni]
MTDQPQRRGDDIVGWEWVRTGPNFALGHPRSRSFGAIWFIIGFVALQGLVAIIGLVALFSAVPDIWVLLRMVLFVLLLVNNIIGLVALIGRHPLAWTTVWISLAMGFPLTLPLVMYWADGTRPNLIYRHRFERLIRTSDEATP